MLTGFGHRVQEEIGFETVKSRGKRGRADNMELVGPKHRSLLDVTGLLKQFIALIYPIDSAQQTS
jgi:hypothetical protein